MFLPSAYAILHMQCHSEVKTWLQGGDEVAHIFFILNTGTWLVWTAELVNQLSMTAVGGKGQSLGRCKYWAGQTRG